MFRFSCFAFALTYLLCSSQDVDARITGTLEEARKYYKSKGLVEIESRVTWTRQYNEFDCDGDTQNYKYMPFDIESREYRKDGEHIMVLYRRGWEHPDKIDCGRKRFGERLIKPKVTIHELYQGFCKKTVFDQIHSLGHVENQDFLKDFTCISTDITLVAEGAEIDINELGESFLAEKTLIDNWKLEQRGLRVFSVTRPSGLRYEAVFKNIFYEDAFDPCNVRISNVMALKWFEFLLLQEADMFKKEAENKAEKEKEKVINSF